MAFAEKTHSLGGIGQAVVVVHWLPKVRLEVDCYYVDNKEVQIEIKHSKEILSQQKLLQPHFTHLIRGQATPQCIINIRQLAVNQLHHP